MGPDPRQDRPLHGERAARWRFATTDPNGQLLLAGITRRRTHNLASAVGRAAALPGWIVEPQLPATPLTLTADLDARGPWSGIMADIAGQYARYVQDGWRRLR